MEEAIHNATNADEFKMRVSGITSTAQAMKTEVAAKGADSKLSAEKPDPAIVKL
jgi:hypothetical protein